MQNKDPHGTALLLAYESGESHQIEVFSDEIEKELYRTDIFFRSYEEWPELEKIAIQNCKGEVLDIGAGAGAHSLYLQEKGYLVTALEISPGCVEVMKKRGVSNAILGDIYKHRGKYDTLLLLMNGIGLAEKLKNLPAFLERLKDLLNPGGRILFDSCDLHYLYEDPFNSLEFPLHKEYYGEVEFQMVFKNQKGNPFWWLYIDEALAQLECEKAGFQFEILGRDDKSQYLTMLRLNE